MAELGRPSEYNPDVHIPIGRALAKAGFTDWEIAEEMDISDRTLYRWKAMYPDFRQALIIEKEVADARVEQAMYNRALGYTIKLKKQIALAGGQGVGSELVDSEYDQHVPADPGLIMSWLSNRQKGKWAVKPEAGDDNQSTLNIQLTVGPVDNGNVEVFGVPAIEEKKD